MASSLYSATQQTNEPTNQQTNRPTDQETNNTTPNHAQKSDGNRGEQVANSNQADFSCSFKVHSSQLADTLVPKYHQTFAPEVETITFVKNNCCKINSTSNIVDEIDNVCCPLQFSFQPPWANAHSTLPTKQT